MASKRNLFISIFLAVLLAFLGATDSSACSEIYIGECKVSARTFDFMFGDGEAILSPRGTIRRSSYVHDGEEPLVWMSRYGSVSFNVRLPGAGGGRPVMAGVDGMNERGLKIGTYFLPTSEFSKGKGLPDLTISLLPQYLLDNFGTVGEVLDDVKSGRYRVISDPTAFVEIKLHLFLHDATGDSAILEFLDGKMRIYRKPDVAVLTNTAYGDSLADLRKYEEFGGERKIPGANESMDRFVRGSFYLRHLPEPRDVDEAVRWGFATVQILSVAPLFPHGCTQWTIVSDIDNRRIFFRTLDNPSVSYIDLEELDFSAGQPLRRLNFRKRDLNGNVNEQWSQ